MKREGRLSRYAVRFRTKWSEESTLELSAMPAQMRGEDVILGVGVLAAPAHRSKQGVEAFAEE